VKAFVWGVIVILIGHVLTKEVVVHGHKLA
jgi:hypothetical protein